MKPKGVGKPCGEESGIAPFASTQSKLCKVAKVIQVCQVVALVGTR